MAFGVDADGRRSRGAAGAAGVDGQGAPADMMSRFRDPDADVVTMDGVWPCVASHGSSRQTWEWHMTCETFPKPHAWQNDRPATEDANGKLRAFSPPAADRSEFAACWGSTLT